MVKTVNFKISDELYYFIEELKVKNRIDSWKDLFEWIKRNQSTQTNEIEQLKALYYKYGISSIKELEGAIEKGTVVESDVIEDLTKIDYLEAEKVKKCPCATCGHPKESHNAGGCWEGGGACECNEFKHGLCACKGEAEEEKVI